MDDKALRRYISSRPMSSHLRLMSSIRDTNPRQTLRDSERNVLKHASHGLTVRMTAELLGLTDQTVTSELKGARLVLGAKNTTHAVALALRAGLIE